MGWNNRPRQAAPLLAALAAAAIAVALDHLAPAPSADVGRGSEEPFATGLYPREIPPGGLPQRWTGARALIRFRDVPSGPATLEVALRGHRSPVVVAFDGVVLGMVAPGQPRAAFAVVTHSRGGHEAELRAEPFVAGDGRSLGAMLQQVRLQHAPARAPSPAFLLEFAIPAAVVAATALAAGFGAAAAIAAATALALLQALLLAPQGLLRSGYAPLLAALLALGAALAAAFARWCERRHRGAGRWAFAALLAAFVMQGVLAASPLMVVSDAVFHANNLARVARGDLFLTSMTQHARPFRFPYGVSFYLLLAPLLRAGLDAVALVRIGAAASAVAGSCVLFLALRVRSSAPRAGMAVLLLQLLPITLDVHSHGNLSNVFGQSLTTGFFAWWAGTTPGGWPLGTVLLVAGSLGHFSSLVVLAALAASLVLLAGRATGRTRALALAAGLALALVYYATFIPLIADQLPRLLEGGGQGRGASRGAWAALRLQLLALMIEWGTPALILAWMGRPRPRSGDSLDRDLTAYWLAGAALAVLAVASPLEVRYLYALTIPLAAAAGAGAIALWARGPAGRAACVVLLVAQAVLAALNAVDALLGRYR